MPRTRYDDDDYGDDASGGAGGSYGGGFYGTGVPSQAGGSRGSGGRGGGGCSGGGCGGPRAGAPLTDRDLPQEIDMDDDDDVSEAPSEECARCGREYYGEFCPACGPEGGPDHQPKAWVRLLGLTLVLAFVIAAMSLLR